MRLRYDWGDGSRVCTLDDGRKCVHPKHPDEPISYAGGAIWGERRARKHRQVPCSTPGCPILDWADGPRGAAS